MSTELYRHRQASLTPPPEFESFDLTKAQKDDLSINCPEEKERVMCIAMPVGPNGPNRFEDVKAIQILLNMNRAAAGIASAVAEDGVWGTHTEDALTAFQRVVMGMASPDGRVEPSGRTLSELRKGMPADFSQAKLRGTIPRAREADIAKFFPQMVPALLTYAIDTPLRPAYFLAQIGHESDALRFTEELASGDAYENRADLGNTQPGDGRKFKGRGLIQLTGRSNYEKYGRAKGRNFTDGDNGSVIATDPQLAVDVACWFWKTHGLNELADQDDVRAVTQRINGGLNGLADREDYLLRSKFFLLPASAAAAQT
jgi:putative chitinase